MIEVENLRRDFCKKRNRSDGRNSSTALDGVSFSVAKGMTYGILGPNGAGKTTLVKILSTILLPTSGHARVAGFDVVRETAQVRRRIGIVFGGDRGLYDRISARQNLVFWGTLYHVEPAVIHRRAAELLDRVGLADRADEPVERFSRGMRQRLHLARGLIGNPDVLFLDEPTVGMDPIATKEFRELVGELRAEGRTILMTTHDMREAQALCDQVTLVDRGRILVTRDTASIGELLAGHEHIDVTLAAGQRGLTAALADLPGVVAVDPLDERDSYRIRTAGEGDVAPVLRWLLDRGITAVRTGRPSLEEVYVHMVGGRGLTV
ncbi:ABC transporter ATP-binding protein [Micromonospora sp. DT46]|uniref:ABC transporter ATP-binding protein n=1 Tax=Micromonospora sp. DT46 TaxID=3393435 RepID=UPI003CF8D235